MFIHALEVLSHLKTHGTSDRCFHQQFFLTLLVALNDNNGATHPIPNNLVAWRTGMRETKCAIPIFTCLHSVNKLHEDLLQKIDQINGIRVNQCEDTIVAVQAITDEGRNMFDRAEFNTDRGDPYEREGEIIINDNTGGRDIAYHVPCALWLGVEDKEGARIVVEEIVWCIGANCTTKQMWLAYLYESFTFPFITLLPQHVSSMSLVISFMIKTLWALHRRSVSAQRGCCVRKTRRKEDLLLTTIGKESSLVKLSTMSVVRLVPTMGDWLRKWHFTARCAKLICTSSSSSPREFHSTSLCY